MLVGGEVDSVSPDDVRDAHLLVGGDVDSVSPDDVRDPHLLVGGEVDSVSKDDIQTHTCKLVVKLAQFSKIM